MLECSWCFWLYWYTYALNNPLRFTDPSGYYNKPSPLERERANGEGIYYNWEMAWKMAGLAGSQFGSYMSRHASGGWEFSSPTGSYVNRFTGERMSASQFDSQFLNPSFNPISLDYDWGVVATIESEGYDLSINVFGRINSEFPKIASDIYKDVTAAFDEQLFNTMVFFFLAKNRYDKEYPSGGLGKKIEKLLFFRSKVNDKTVYDIKRSAFSVANLGSEYGIYRGHPFRYDDFGNYNYGVAARYFGLSLDEALLGAGLNQIRKLNPDLSNTLGFFDHSQDTYMIIGGYSHEW